ncbi:MAG TPA: ABC transporter permease [Sphingomicrobium sp.]|jgi:ABC-2 type transport system permease protein|nr:ABC transporter permease [Sphingomicrobium sp.]
MMRFIRSAFVIARRDFGATVLSKTFIFFLLAPLFPLLMGGVFGSIGARVATQAARPVVAVVSSDKDFDRLSSARSELAQALGEDTMVSLVHYPAEPNLALQKARLLSSRNPPIRAVLTGGIDHPRLTGSVADDPGTLGQLRLVIANARSPGEATPALLPVTNVESSSGSEVRDRALTAQIGQMLLFFFTILLAGMLLSQVIEEKSNKIIEVIAAAIRIDAMFVGKLFAMLAASITGIVVWISAGAVLIQIMKHGGVATLPAPAIGWPGFLALGIIYFAMNYLLLGAAFLTIGAQASTVREVQTMSLPVTFTQMLIFGFASTAIGSPDSPTALAAAIFPLSSPMAMIARAAEDPQWWPQLVAILWQGLWVALIIHFGAMLFRKTVLKSGPQSKWWRLKRA